ncbi:hypothetical protein [Kitasatospora sp. NPDC085879]|uniref:hypothetical protein n=1 Tax=Kitasatospora sp. NPDC085879 TaxID=3154769 RepID=UPI00342EFFEB
MMVLNQNDSPAEKSFVVSRKHLDANAGLEIVARDNSLSLLNRHGATVWAIEHPQWDGTSFEISADGNLLWATMPGPDYPWETDEDESEEEEEDDEEESDTCGPGWIGVHDDRRIHLGAPENHGDEWWVVEAATGRVLATTPLGVYPAATTSIGHPNGVDVGLGIGVHDGPSETFWGRYVNDALHVGIVPTPGMLEAISPSGRSYLTLTMLTASDTGGTLTLKGFPDHQVIAQRTSADHLAPGEWFGWAEYLDDERILVEVFQAATAPRKILLDAGNLTLLGEAQSPTR